MIKFLEFLSFNGEQSRQQISRDRCKKRDFNFLENYDPEESSLMFFLEMF